MEPVPTRDVHVRRVHFDYEWQLPGVEFWLRAHGVEHADEVAPTA